MSDYPVIVDAVRTPIGRAHAEKGFYRQVRGDTLAAECLRALVARSQIDPAVIDDVLLGCTQQTGEQGLNVARNAVLLAGLPSRVAGASVNRLCGSSLQALNQACHAIAFGAENVHLVGGVEHMQHLPLDHAIDINPRLYERTSQGALHMGVTAEFLAQTQGISRSDQDAFALRSHQLAAAAQQKGEFTREIVPTFGHNERGERTRFDFDQCVRPDTNAAQLAALEPAFLPKLGTITAGNSSPLNDGAAALLVMSHSKARELGLRPLVRIRGTAVAGVDPCVMGTGPVPASQLAVARAGLTLDDLDLIEINEAFAAQTLACIRLLGLKEDRVNVRGGAIAIGHPLGASGARIVTTLMNAMLDRGARFGLATMCIGLGQGIATVLERME